MFNKLYSKIKENIIYVVFFTILIIFLILFKIELPYTIYMGGGTISVSKTIKVTDENINTGTYKSLYVLSSKANPITYLIAKINNKWDLIKNEEMILNSDESYDDIFTRNRLMLEYSKNVAIKTAYIKANKTYNVKESNLYIIGSECEIKIGEQLVKIDDITINNKEDIISLLETKNVNDSILIETKYKDKTYKRNIKIREKDGKKVIGIYLIKIDKYDIEPNIEIKSEENEAGSSAGLMITLAIYDKLIDLDLSKGLKIVGTGTIEEDGSVGKIDGLKHKMLGLSKEKYDIFFIPFENKEEADKINEEYNLNMKYIPVKTFDEAVNYLLSVKK